jgi:hypothetical protein
LICGRGLPTAAATAAPAAPASVAATEGAIGGPHGICLCAGSPPAVHGRVVVGAARTGSCALVAVRRQRPGVEAVGGTPDKDSRGSPRWGPHLPVHGVGADGVLAAAGHGLPLVQQAVLKGDHAARLGRHAHPLRPNGFAVLLAGKGPWGTLLTVRPAQGRVQAPAVRRQERQGATPTVKVRLLAPERIRARGLVVSSGPTRQDRGRASSTSEVCWSQKRLVASPPAIDSRTWAPPG